MNKSKHFLNSVLIIAYRDILKFLNDKARIAITFIFPIIFVGVLGQSSQANLSSDVGYNFLKFIFTGILAQTVFSSAASGVISLIEDRENDFSQEMFVSPVSRYAILIGKIIGESAVALIQGVGVIAFGFITGVSLSLTELLAMIPILFLACIFGGAFGILVLANLANKRSANQIFPFLIFPQFFLAGIFSPVKNLPLWLDILSHLAPLRYIVDMLRGVIYLGTPEYDKIVIASPFTNFVIIAVLTGIFLFLGTILFTRNEKNR